MKVRVGADQPWCRRRDPVHGLQHCGFVRCNLGVFDDLVGADVVGVLLAAVLWF